MIGVTALATHCRYLRQLHVTKAVGIDARSINRVKVVVVSSWIY
jgi:hypothetical protein